MFSKSCLDIWKEESQQLGIVTFCKDLDVALGSSGVPVGQITEFCGPPGSGKTQLCIQLSVSTQIPAELGGLGGKTMFFDTNFGFTPQRLEEMATGCVQHCQKLVSVHRKGLAYAIRDFTVDKLMDGVYYKHIQQCSELLDGINSLERLLRAEEKIRLVVLDSMSYIIRNNIENTMERIRIGYQILTKLHALANQYKCAVIITNDVTTRFNPNDPSSSMVVPALGESHSHKINQRIILGPSSNRDDAPGTILASIGKSLLRPSATVKFHITEAGIRRFRKK
ncbi:DNA repair protein RAD51 homolog 3 [Sabethes cyaneus]|uniref:DNA repair protein RAD51 homolog 3 n=1 Tax=Sabethes cyaneus TaxID=53552 RepID=UPI00237EC5F8|nr:DNA repair protein RAD51 homolog 3 [Sabethes cyaneus]